MRLPHPSCTQRQERITHSHDLLFLLCLPVFHKNFRSPTLCLKSFSYNSILCNCYLYNLRSIRARTLAQDNRRCFNPIYNMAGEDGIFSKPFKAVSKPFRTAWVKRFWGPIRRWNRTSMQQLRTRKIKEQEKKDAQDKRNKQDGVDPRKSSQAPLLTVYLSSPFVWCCEYSRSQASEIS